MAVTPDAVELPIYVTDNLDDMASKFQVKKNVVTSSIAHGHNGKKSGRKFLRVEVEE